jgi:hypothetical protein
MQPAALDPEQPDQPQPAAEESLRYLELVEQQEASRKAFGRMFLNWRLRCGWSLNTACNAAADTNVETLPDGTLAKIEQGEAGELKREEFFQLAELNRRVAESDWGRVTEKKLHPLLEQAKPIGDPNLAVWGAVEFWACYCGLRPVPMELQSPPSETTQAD